ncbi:MAG: type II secretion system F family protein [Anaerolineae bacterium]|nr:type II secretion system F family protein [Anaerolineae bacterium]
MPVLAWLFYVVLIVLAWGFRSVLYEMARNDFSLIAGMVGGVILFVILALLVDYHQNQLFRSAWRERMAAQNLFPPETPWWRGRRKDGPLNRLLAPVFRNSVGQAVLNTWEDAGFGGQAAGFVVAVILVFWGGYAPGYLLTSSLILGGLTAFLANIGLAVLIYSRARLHRQRFGDQFPDVLDRMSDALLAGFSLPQAMDFIIPNLFEPSASEMARVTAQIGLGHSVDEALNELYARRPSEDVRLLVEGLTLQRQVGGDMPAMMRDMAEFVRGRVELEREVRTLTAQGRLSAIVIALLVPVSLGILSMFPGYTDALFNTLLGNLVLVTAVLLELIGAALVSRLIRIDY